MIHWDVLCDSCSEPALSIAADLVSMLMAGGFETVGNCKHCNAPGKVVQVDDGEQAMLVFRTEVAR